MRLLYQGTDITGQVNVTACRCRETSGGQCDSLFVEMLDAQAWYRWKPDMDDRIEVTEGSYTTGRLYLNACRGEDGRFTLAAASMPAKAYRRASGSYAGMTLEAIMALCAAECGMEAALYGLDGRMTYGYLSRTNQSAPAFLNGLLALEGAAFKTVGGRLAGISVEAMQEKDAAKTLRLTADQRGVTHTARRAERLGSLTIKTPYCQCTAYDAGAPDGEARVVTDKPALNAAQGGRWARGMLMMHNRQAETLSVETAFDEAFCAMGRIDVEAETEIAGRWLIEVAEHDLIRGRSRAVMRRCIDTFR